MFEAADGSKIAADKADFGNVNRVRVVNTAEHQSRNKSIVLKPEDRGDSFGDIAGGQVKISALLEEKQQTAPHSKAGNATLEQSKPVDPMNLGDINRWNASLESPGLTLNASETNHHISKAD